jgi:flagellar hook-length control protein FliK
VLSATQDAAASANAAFQAAPSWLTRSNTPPANDLFGDLVSQNTQNDSTAAPPAPLPAQNGPDAPPPAADTAASANNANNNASSANSNAPTPPPASDASSNAANDGPPSNDTSDATGPANANSNGATTNGTSQSTTTATTSGTSKPDDHKSKDEDADATVVDATILAQQIGNAPTTPTPVAVAVPTSTPATNAPATAPASGGPTAPLAIAAAAIAASSQPLSLPPGPSGQVKTDPGTTPTVTSGSAPTATKAVVSTPAIPVNTGAQTAGTTAPVDSAALTTAVAATVPVTSKTAQGKAEALATTTAATNSTATEATGASTNSSQDGATAQTPTTETANLAAQGTTTDTAATPAASTHDHAVSAAAAAHVVTEAADPSAQALGAVQPQLNSSSPISQTGNLTATAATNGAVPLSGLAVEIAANVKGGKSTFEIRLDPADLGRIDVRVQIDQNGQVTSHLTVEKPETLSMLRQDAPQLQQALNDAGLKTGSGGLQFSLRDQSSSGQNSGNDSNPNAQRLIITDEDAVPASVAGRSYGRSTGSSSGVDIRV